MKLCVGVAFIWPIAGLVGHYVASFQLVGHPPYAEYEEKTARQVPAFTLEPTDGS
jgi:hypothetical protein